MKNYNYLTIFLVIGATLLTVGCVSGRKTRAVNAHLQRLRDDSTATARRNAQVLQLRADSTSTARRNAKEKQLREDSTATASRLGTLQNPAPVAEPAPAAVKNPTPTKGKPKQVTIGTKAVPPFPPVMVSANFKSVYPAIKQVQWAKTKPALNAATTDPEHYQANFAIADNAWSVLYTENGEVVETRTEILPSQMPLDVHLAIQQKYPNAEVISAATFKHVGHKGSYVAHLKSPTDSNPIEVILTEAGEFVK